MKESNQIQDKLFYYNITLRLVHITVVVVEYLHVLNVMRLTNETKEMGRA
jgi:hypothetical protein